MTATTVAVDNTCRCRETLRRTLLSGFHSTTGVDTKLGSENVPASIIIDQVLWLELASLRLTEARPGARGSPLDMGI